MNLIHAIEYSQQGGILSRFDSMAKLLDSISLTATHDSTGGQSFKNPGLSSGIKGNP